MKQTILTIIAKVNSHRLQDLKKLLEGIGKPDVEHNPHIPFLDLKLLHFASFVVNQDQNYGAYLVFENNFDGPLDPYLEELYAHAAEGLHSIYSCCSDYSAASAADKTQLLSYLRARIVYPNAYHIGNVGRSVERTHQEANLRDRLEDFLDDVVSQGNMGLPSSIRERVQTFTRGQTTLKWATSVPAPQTRTEYLLPRLRIVLTAIVALALLPLLIPLAILWLIVLRWTETHEPPPGNPNINAHVKDLVEREDRTHIVQNHMCSITTVKPGLFRQVTLRGVLWVINLLARLFDKGELSGIPSIHFAHWSLIDNGRRLLFLSNFDGSWENYLDDFIDKAATGLTAIWTNTVGFPRANWLVRDGARDGSRFKAYARATQIKTNVWYSAYKSLTVQAIENNSGIREDLFTALDDAATRDWLRRF
jgi:hypothetical protein